MGELFMFVFVDFDLQIYRKMSLVDLILKADLINPQFEGYRLSLDHLPLFATHLEAEQSKNVMKCEHTSFRVYNAIGHLRYLNLPVSC